MDELVAVLDADVLVPILTCDLLLTAFDHDLYRPVITPGILDEVERNLLRAHPGLDPVRLRRRVDAMRRSFVLHSRPDSGLTVEGVNAKDQHVASAAIESEAHVVVTNDRRLRREIGALEGTLAAGSADAFALDLLDRDPDGIADVLATLVAKRVRRPVSRDELLDQLSGPLPTFARQVRST